MPFDRQGHGQYIVSDMKHVAIKPYKKTAFPELSFNRITNQHVFGSFGELQKHGGSHIRRRA